MKELFYFYPERFGYIFSSIDDVYVVGEFNNWGKDLENLEKYKLIKDKTNKWIGLFEVPQGRGFYKFFLNKNTYCPSVSLLFYSAVSTPDWAKRVIWYQIMPDRFYKGDKLNHTPNLIPWDSPPNFFNNFGGNFKGIKEKLWYLKNLFGSLENTALYLNPVHKSLASNHKYWAEDFDAIDSQFGSEEDLKELIDSIHKEKGKIILDLVYNHTGLNHYAFLDILKNGENSGYFDWYRKLPLPEKKIEIPILENYLDNKPQNIYIENDPRNKNYDFTKESYINIWDGKYKFFINNPDKFRESSIEEILNNQPYYKLVHSYNNPNYKCWSGFFEMPELNNKNQELKKHLFKAARKWIKLGVDGFRLDVPDILENAHQFWQEFRQEIKEEAALNKNKNPDDIYIVGEIWSCENLTASFLYGNEDSEPIRFNAIMNYPIREEVFNFLSGEILNKAADSVAKTGEISVSDLDKNLHKNLAYISWGVSQNQFNVFSSHDTRRIRNIFKDDSLLKAALIMQFTFPGAPVIYYGDELGMSGGKDPNNRAAMKWDIFENLSSYYSEEKLIFNFFKKLINLRNKYSCFIEAPVLTVYIDDKNKIYSYARYNENNDCAIIIISKNNIKNNINIDISDLPFEDILSWENYLTGKKYINHNKNIIIQPEDLDECFGLVLVSG
ncbi:MAG: alpha-amylase family glycosyl hydrolase [bacterium]